METHSEKFKIPNTGIVEIESNGFELEDLGFVGCSKCHTLQDVEEISKRQTLLRQIARLEAKKRIHT